MVVVVARMMRTIKERKRFPQNLILNLWFDHPLHGVSSVLVLVHSSGHPVDTSTHSAG